MDLSGFYEGRSWDGRQLGLSASEIAALRCNRRGSVVQIVHKVKAGSGRKGTEYIVLCNFLFPNGAAQPRTTKVANADPCPPQKVEGSVCVCLD